MPPAPDGVWYEPNPDSRPIFRQVRPPKQRDIERLAMSVRRRIIRRLARMGVLESDLLEGDCDTLAEDEPTLALCMSVSLLDRVAVGKRAGDLILRLREDVLQAKPRGSKCAEVDGFNIHAATTVAAGKRDRLEQLCRLCGRPHKRHHADRIVMRISR